MWGGGGVVANREPGSYIPRSSFRGAFMDVWGAGKHHPLGLKKHPNWKMLVGELEDEGSSTIIFYEITKIQGEAVLVFYGWLSIG